MGKASGIVALIALGALFGCGGGGGGGATVPVRPTPLTFTSWSSTPNDQVVQLRGVAQEVPYTLSSQGNVQAVDPPSALSSSTSLVIGYHQNSGPPDLLVLLNRPSGGSIGAGGYNIPSPPGTNASAWGIPNVSGWEIPGSMTPVGDPTVGYLDTSFIFALGGSSLFTTLKTADPHILGWNYQTFGIWDDPPPPLGGTGYFGAISAGAATPDTSIPSSGTATFAGKEAGYYVSPTPGGGGLASADVTVTANFSSRSLNYSSSSTMLNGTTATPNLDLAGTLTYAPQKNGFTGTLTNAGKTMSGTSTGRFYGPNAEELGGIFVLRAPAGVETFTGAYGAKR